MAQYVQDFLKEENMSFVSKLFKYVALPTIGIGLVGTFLENNGQDVDVKHGEPTPHTASFDYGDQAAEAYINYMMRYRNVSLDGVPKSKIDNIKELVSDFENIQITPEDTLWLISRTQNSWSGSQSQKLLTHIQNNIDNGINEAQACVYGVQDFLMESGQSIVAPDYILDSYLREHLFNEKYGDPTPAELAMAKSSGFPVGDDTTRLDIVTESVMGFAYTTDRKFTLTNMDNIPPPAVKHSAATP